MELAFMDAMYQRHATKIFDETKTIEEKDLLYILEAGRLSPSALGLEHWKFLVTSNKDLKNKLQKACYNQPQVGTASHIIIVLAKISELEPDSDYVTGRLIDLVGKESLEDVRDFYKGFYKNVDKRQWSIAQTNLAAANMMTAGAIRGVDSCPIGGFVHDMIADIIKLDKTKYEISLVIPFGYRLNKLKPKTRLPLNKIVEIIE